MFRLILVVLILAVSTASWSAYTARLYFENLTKGTSNTGAVWSDPGDEIAIRYSFTGDGADPDRWGSLQVTLDLDGLAMIDDAQADTWDEQISPLLTPVDWFPLVVYWEPGLGDMGDFAIDPSNTSSVATTRGLYLLAGLVGSAPYAKGWGVTLFTFTIQPGSESEVLDWMYDGRETGASLSTRILDAVNHTVDITDNYVRIVPEPSGAWIGLVVALGACAAWRKSRHE